MIDLSDTTLIIPVRFDNTDRFRNVAIVLNFISKYCNTNFLIAEQDDRSKLLASYFNVGRVRHLFLQTNDPLFYKTRVVNQAVKRITTPYFAIYDADVLVHPEQYHATLELLRSKQADAVYPYDGRFLNVPVNNIPHILEKMDLHFIKENECTRGYGMPEVSPNRESVGGAVFYNRQKFIECGMANENIVSYGPEDAELAWRFSKLSILKRVDGPLFHLTHARGLNSGESHHLARANHAEFRKILSMDAKQLRDYVETWNWKKGVA